MTPNLWARPELCALVEVKTPTEAAKRFVAGAKKHSYESAVGRLQLKIRSDKNAPDDDPI